LSGALDRDCFASLAMTAGSGGRAVAEPGVQSVMADHPRVLRQHIRRGDLDHQPVLQPELDDMEHRWLARRAAAEIAGTPALALADPPPRGGSERPRQQQRDRLVIGRRLVLGPYLCIVLAGKERDGLWVYLDHRAVFVAAHRHERIRDAAGKR